MSTKQPIGCPFSNPNKLWLLKKTLYVLQYSSHHWFEKLISTLRYTVLTASPNKTCVYTDILNPVGGGAGHIHWSQCGRIYLLEWIWQGRGTVQGGSLLKGPSQLTRLQRIVPGNTIWVVKRSNRQPISPHVPVRIFRSHLQKLWYWQQQQIPYRHTI